MEKRKEQRGASAKGGGAKKQRRERQLVRLDQEPLRSEAAAECTRALANLEKLRGHWRRYQEEDIPAYERWSAATFGPILSQLREAEALLREKAALAREVEIEMVYGGARTYRAAYAAVEERRKNPPKRDDSAPPPPDFSDAQREDEGDEAEEAGGLDEFEQTMIFEEFLRSVLGMNPDRMSDAKYEKLFAEFREKFLGGGGAKEPETRSAPSTAKPESSRLKELYRVLVRRLHPDTRADNDPSVSAIWHDVQDAYQTGNVERLEMLVALTEIREEAPGEKTSVAQMRAVFAELISAAKALKRSLRSARQDAAWDFVRAADRAALRKKLQRGYEATLGEIQAKVHELEHLIRQWSIPPKMRPSQRAKEERQTQQAGQKANDGGRKPDVPRQTDFSF
jgi:hypothetical protein